MLEVSQAGYYAWRSRPPSPRAIRHAWLTDAIREVHAASRQTYGSRRVHAELTLGRGISVGYHAVELLMRRAGLQGVTGRPKFRRGLRPEATTGDLVNRQSLVPVNVVQSAFPEEQQGEISGLSRSVSNLGSSLGTAIAGTILVFDLTSGTDPMHWRWPPWP